LRRGEAARHLPLRRLDPELSRVDETERTIIRRADPNAGAGENAVMHLLQVDHPPEEPPRRVILGDLPLRIGRVAGVDLVLASPEVSRAHCSVSLEGGRAVVTDLGSTNGTYVNDQRIDAPTPLDEGARLRIGPFVLAYLRGARRTLERAAELERNLDRAARYVRALLPPAIHDGPIRVTWRFEPSVAVGGDGFGYRLLPDGRFILWLIDAAGHGLHSALLAASAMTVLREGGPAGVDPADCAGVLAALDASFEMERHDGLFFTLWYGIYDPATRRMTHTSGGHHPAYLIRPGGAAEPVGTRNPPVGVGQITSAIKVGSVTIPPGSRLHIFSDGTFETLTPEGYQNSLRDFLPVLDHPPQPGTEPPEQLLRAARTLAGGALFDDDVSIVTVDFD
jgi:serine phosphatase RsbU (regulator of sigma subunit)